MDGLLVFSPKRHLHIIQSFERFRRSVQILFAMEQASFPRRLRCGLFEERFGIIQKGIMLQFPCRPRWRHGSFLYGAAFRRRCEDHFRFDRGDRRRHLVWREISEGNRN